MKRDVAYEPVVVPAVYEDGSRCAAAVATCDASLVDVERQSEQLAGRVGRLVVRPRGVPVVEEGALHPAMLKHPGEASLYTPQR